MARPVGQFEQMKTKMLAELRFLAQLGVCFATDSYLQKRLNRGPAQVQRYLAALRKEGRIIILTQKAKRGENGRLYRKRIIRLTTHLGQVARPTLPPKRFKFDETWDIQLDPGTHGIVEAELSAAMSALVAEEQAKAEARTLSDSLNPDKQYDEEAILAELRAEWAAAGIMEI